VDCGCAIGELLHVQPHHCLTEASSDLVRVALLRPDLDGQVLDYTELCLCLRTGFAVTLIKLELAADYGTLRARSEACRGFASTARAFAPLLDCTEDACVAAVCLDGAPDYQQ
jgi:hypothetical protein